MNEAFKVVRITKNKTRDESGVISGPKAASMASNLANFWASDQNNKHVQILSGQTEGINANKFFLHRIVKG